MDKFTLKTALIISLGGCLLLCILFLFKFYIPNHKAVEKNTAKIQEMKQKIHIESAHVSKLKDEISSFDSHAIHLNYFNRLHQPEFDRIPYLLKILTNEANALDIKFISVEPKPPKDKNFYEKYIFVVEVWAAKYLQLFHFLDYIQNKLTLNIDELTIQPDKENSHHLRAKVSLNTLEMRDNQLKDFENISQMKHFFLDPNRQDTRKENSYSPKTKQKYLMTQAVRRNPFESNLFLSSLQSETEKALRVTKNDKELVLRAIINFEEERIAILGNDRIKKGETLKNIQIGDQYIDLKVLKIGENSVTLGYGQEEYPLKLPDNPITFK